MDIWRRLERNDVIITIFYVRATFSVYIRIYIRLGMPTRSVRYRYYGNDNIVIKGFFFFSRGGGGR